MAPIKMSCRTPNARARLQDNGITRRTEQLTFHDRIATKEARTGGGVVQCGKLRS
ncbi:MAG: hypothetical protein NVS1B4_06500 [Gemmatimonadaceae bacterium]